MPLYRPLRADERPDRPTDEMLDFLEGIGIGVRFDADDPSDCQEDGAPIGSRHASLRDMFTLLELLRWEFRIEHRSTEEFLKSHAVSVDLVYFVPGDGQEDGEEAGAIGLGIDDALTVALARALRGYHKATGKLPDYFDDLWWTEKVWDTGARPG